MSDTAPRADPVAESNADGTRERRGLSPKTRKLLITVGLVGIGIILLTSGGSGSFIGKILKKLGIFMALAALAPVLIPLIAGLLGVVGAAIKAGLSRFRKSILAGATDDQAADDSQDVIDGVDGKAEDINSKNLDGSRMGGDADSEIIYTEQQEEDGDASVVQGEIDAFG